MTLEEIKNRVMFQTNNDADDVDEYLPYLVNYINEGYDILVDAYAHQHLGTSEYPYLVEPGTGEESPSPATPEWTHSYLADYATWMIYRNGNPQKQQRGAVFRASFEEMIAKIRGEGGADGTNADGTLKAYLYFNNIPR